MRRRISTEQKLSSMFSLLGSVCAFGMIRFKKFGLAFFVSMMACQLAGLYFAIRAYNRQRR